MDVGQPVPNPTPTANLLPLGAVAGSPDPGAGSNGLIRVMTPGAVTALEDAKAAEKEQRRLEAQMEPALEDLSAYIRKKFDDMKRHRDSDAGWTTRMLDALRMFNGEYPPEKLAAIRSFGGSELYARIVAVKCRASAAMLRDIYLAADSRPWGIDPTPNPTLPDDPREAITNLVAAEAGIAGQAAQTGAVDPNTGMPIQPPTEEEIVARRTNLENAAEDAARRQAREEAEQAERYLDDILVEGGFYTALAEFLTDLPLFPFAAIRGPIVYMTPTITWEKGPPGPDGKRGKPVMKKETKPRMFWKRVSPFDLWWSGGASNVMGADFVYRDRKSRSELNSMLDVKGYNQDALRNVLTEYPRGITESPTFADSDRAQQESREDPAMNESGMYDILEYYGSVPGKMLLEWGMAPGLIKDSERDYVVQLWMIGRYVIKTVLTPSPRERPPFYITSYDKVPGTMVGNAVPDMLSDIQDVCNATLRSLVNNMAMASGPQVAVNGAVIDAGEDTERIWPWRVWKTSPRLGSSNSGEPVKFFQPSSNAQELLGVYEKFTQIADEISAIPRYVTGSERMGGAGRTASGLAMLMGNASKMLQTVAANVDIDVFQPLLEYLYDIMMLTDDTGRLRGDERIAVRGVAVAMQKETERQRQLEMLQATANPIDSQIIGLRGRGALLRQVVKSLGLDGEIIVPSDADLAARERGMQAKAVASPPGAPGAPPGMPDMAAAGAQAQGAQQGGEQTGPSAIQGPRTNLQSQPPM